jgi:hypothetical protein
VHVVTGQDAIAGQSLGQAGANLAAQAPRDRLRHAVARLDEAEAKGETSGLVDALLNVAHCYKVLCSYAAADDFFRQALRAARCSGSLRAQIDVLIQLAQLAGLRAKDLQDQDAATARVNRDRARDSAFEASILIHKAHEAPWAPEALLAVSEVLAVCGDHDDAAGMRARAARWQTA